MFGIARINNLAYAAGGAPASARASAAAYSNAQGTPTFPTSGGKFVGYFNAAADQTGLISTNPSDTSWYFDSNKLWTVEFWLKVSTTSWSATSPIIILNPTGGNTSLSLAATGTSNTVGFYVGGTLRTTTTLSTTFQHFAFVNNSTGSLVLYKNGTSLTTVTWSNNYNSRALRFGQDFNVAGLNIQFDEIRISNIRRYTANFTAPTAAHTNDANTVGLFHFNAGSTNDDTA
jgi:hypothetical protein